ncbi:MAG: hypothetical protein HC902_11795 [Calothrix sp. SM1_5_4]|nr:hypothetical protein [Calothrix sp. SM1_5_4]
MKIVSVVFFAFALVGTWMIAHAKRPVTESVHIGIQNDLQRIIAEYVQKNLPESKNFRFQKFWTETVNKNKVKAYFVYSFEDKTEEGEPAEVEIEGSAMLNKIEETPETSTWSFDELQILDNKVNFTEPIHITAGSGELENAPATNAPATSEPPKEDSKHE